MNDTLPQSLEFIEQQPDNSAISRHTRERTPVLSLVRGSRVAVCKLNLINYSGLLLFSGQVFLALGMIVTIIVSNILINSAGTTSGSIFDGMVLWIVPLVLFVIALLLLLRRLIRGAIEIEFEPGALGPVRVIHEHPRTRLDARECVVCMQIANEWVVLMRGVGLKRVNRLLATLRDAGVDNITESTIVRDGPFRKGSYKAMLLWGIFRRRRLRVRADGSVEWLDGGPR